jgi:hypothetical protein
MNEQNRQRLGRMTKRHTTRVAQGSGEAESDAAFLAEFGRIRDEVLQPVMHEVGAQLRADGYDFQVTSRGSETSPVIDFHIVIPGRSDSKDTIRFFARKDALRGWQIIAEIELKRSPMELARFDAGDPITRDVAEQLIVDATEQTFASALAAPRREADTASSSPAPQVRSAGGEVAPADTEPSARTEAVEGVRALVLERLRAGRLLYGLNLVGADLRGLNFTNGVMPALDLRDANLSGCKLTGTLLVAARLDGADLTDADLMRADLTRANLSGATLAGARLDGAVLRDTVGLVLPTPEGAAARAPEPPTEGAPAPALAEAPATPAATPAHVDAVRPLHELPPAPSFPAQPDAPEARWACWAGAPRMGETEEVNVAAFRDVPLPFVEGPPAPSFFAELDAARADQRSPRRVTGDETMAMPVIHAPAANGASLTVEQYAAYCAELNVFSGESERIHGKYGVASTDARASLNAAFAERFGSDPTLQRKWRALVTHYEGWYRRQVST